MTLTINTTTYTVEALEGYSIPRFLLTGPRGAVYGASVKTDEMGSEWVDVFGLGANRTPANFRNVILGYKDGALIVKHTYHR